MLRALRLVLWIAVLGVGASCGGAGRGAQEPPGPAVARWGQAARGQDARAAYRLLSTETRKEVSFEQFEAEWNASQAERAAQADALAEAQKKPGAIAQRASVKLPDGKTAEMVHEDGGWRLETPILSSVRALTPQDALRYLLRAAEDRSLDRLLRIMTADGRERFKSLLSAFLEGLAANLGKEIPVSGDRAVLEWKDEGGTWRVKLVREDGEWRIDDVIPPR